MTAAAKILLHHFPISLFPEEIACAQESSPPGMTSQNKPEFHFELRFQWPIRNSRMRGLT
jgi:hypothetical protein